jgi:hypothetical protein
MGTRATKPAPPPEPKSNNVNAKEIIVHEERNNYPSLFNIDARNDHYGEPSGFQLNWWYIGGIIAALVFLFYVLWKIRRCSHKCKKKKAEKESKREAAEQARDHRIEAIAMSPIIKEDLTEKLKWNTDRFEEINEKIDKMKKIVETEPAATQRFFPQTNAMAQLPPVTLPYGGSMTNIPAITFLDNGRPHRTRGRRH